MDKAMIFADLTRRNALRKAHGLPLLNVAAEYAHEVAVAAQRDFQVIYDRHAADHADERKAIREQVLAECRAQHGHEFGQTMAGRWTINSLTQKRFAAYIAETYALSAPDRATSRHTVTYGAGRKDKV